MHTFVLWCYFNYQQCSAPMRTDQSFIKRALFIPFSDCPLALAKSCKIPLYHENIISAILTQMDTGSLTQSNAYWGFFKDPPKRKSELRS